MLSSGKSPRKFLSGDGLIRESSDHFNKVPDHRLGKTQISISDALLSAFAMYSLKDSSLLQFVEREDTEVNLKSIYRINRIPSDTHMRSLIDPIDPAEIKPIFRKIHNHLQRGKVLENYVFMDGHYLISVDGTGFFSSYDVHCPNCLEKRRRNGEIEYSHQMLGAVLLHPDHKEVFPIAPEFIVKQDGHKKNDCERNAAKRFLAQLRKDHPKLKIIIIEDALASNSPHIEELAKYNMRYILGVKPGDHKFLFNYVAQQAEQGNVSEFELQEGRITHKFRYINDVPLNASNAQTKVNFLEYWEFKDGALSGKKHFSWVTDFKIKDKNTYQLMRGGRSRWKVENETFNTLKNQGYHFEHNFGHGNQHLANNFALIMMLAFLIDQVQQHCCGLFRSAWKKSKRKKTLWQDMLSKFKEYDIESMEQLLKMIAYGHKRMKASDLIDDSS